jgi:DNA-binding transcriptional LysR family regulator
MSVTIRQLRAFVAIARLGSFIDASRTMHLTQAALSNLIRELEKSVGTRLLDRTTRKVSLSPAGSQYFPYAERVLATLLDAERCASNLRSHQRGVVRIATSRLVGWSLMARLFSQFHQSYPDVRVMPVDVLIEDLRSSVTDGKADLAISRCGNLDGVDLFDVTPLFKSRVHIVCRPDHRFALRKSVAWNEVLTETLIFVGNYPLLHLQLELGGEFSPMDIHEVGDTTAALSLVAAGIGITVCPGFVKSALGMHNLCLVECEQPVISRQFGLFSNKQETLLPVVQEHKRFIENYFSGVKNQFVEDTELCSPL